MSDHNEKKDDNLFYVLSLSLSLSLSLCHHTLLPDNFKLISLSITSLKRRYFLKKKLARISQHLDCLKKKNGSAVLFVSLSGKFGSRC